MENIEYEEEEIIQMSTRDVCRVFINGFFNGLIQAHQGQRIFLGDMSELAMQTHAWGYRIGVNEYQMRQN